MNACIGIDPGLSGAVALVHADGTAEVHDMPVAKGRSGKNEILAAELYKLMARLGDHEIWIEQVSAHPGQGVTSMFRFGDAFGLARGIAAAMQMPAHYVTPQVWKRAFGLAGVEKDASRVEACRLYPNVDLARKKDHGRADALLIARYGLNQTLRGNGSAKN